MILYAIHIDKIIYSYGNAMLKKGVFEKLFDFTCLRFLREEPSLWERDMILTC